MTLPPPSFSVEIELHPGARGAWPVSVNYMHYRGWSLTADARAWRRTVEQYTWRAWCLDLIQAARDAFEAAPAWRVELVWHLRRRADLDNWNKLVLDGIKRGTGIDDKRYVPDPRDGEWKRGQPRRLVIIITALEKGD